MSEAIVKFIFEGDEMTIQCKKNEKMKSICQKYSGKIRINLNSLIFLYRRKQINFDLTFYCQAILFFQYIFNKIKI